MDGFELPLVAQQWANTILVWVGFGTIVGLLAKAIMPGRDPGGPVATLMMGITGTVIGCGLFTLAYGKTLVPISPMGFAVGTAGAFIILFFFKLLSGYWFVEEGTETPRRFFARPAAPRAPRYSARRPSDSLAD